MADQPDDTDGLTPMQRALKAKNAAVAARSGPPKGKFKGDQAAAHASASKSKPWMKA
jgi:hypothetical protein